MAFSLGALSAWADEHTQALNFYTAATMANDAVPAIREYGEVLTGIKADSIKLPTLTQTAAIADGNNCTFSDAATTTITQTTMTMKNCKTQGILCVRDLEDYFSAVTLPAGQHYEGLGGAESAILNEIIRQSQKAIAKELWSGGPGTGLDGTVLDGYIEVLNDSAATATSTQTIDVGDGTFTDASAAYNVINGLIDAAFADEDLAGEAISGNLVIFLAPVILHYFRRGYEKTVGDKLTTGPLVGPLTNPALMVTINGTNVTLVPQNGLSQNPNFVILTRRQNFVLGFDLESDMTRLEVGFDQYRENMWWKLRWKMGVAIRDTSSSSLLFNGVVS